jgi:hypothetical protein
VHKHLHELMECVVELSQTRAILVVTFTANAPNDEGSIDNFGRHFADLHPDSNITAPENQIKEVGATIC